jgi:lambda repressor-like predicted transcriptional regulator
MDELSRRAKIRELLFAKGYTLSLVDRKFDLKKNTASKTLQIPHHDGEAAIAAVLGVKNRFELWPDRYSSSGQRLSPLKYERPPTLAQRRNGRSQLAAVFAFGSLILSSLLTGDQARAADFQETYCGCFYGGNPNSGLICLQGLEVRR